MRKVALGDNVKANIIARGTPGFSGADLSNLVNEAALFAARANKKLVDMEEFERAKDKIMMGAERRSLVMSEEEKKLTAYHEAGHAIVGRLVPSHDPVYKVTIIPRGRALGVTMFLPEEDRLSYSKELLNSQISSLFGGRIAEELIFRAWFLEELKMGYGIKIAIFTQALVFSLIHPISDNSFWNIIGLRLGWFFLGIFLSLLRIKDNGSLWECIGIHGGLVGIWFFINHGLIKIADNTPSFLAGPFTQNVSNPIGSFFAIVILISLCILYLGKSNNKAIL